VIEHSKKEGKEGLLYIIRIGGKICGKQAVGGLTSIAGVNIRARGLTTTGTRIKAGKQKKIKKGMEGRWGKMKCYNGALLGWYRGPTKIGIPWNQVVDMALKNGSTQENKRLRQGGGMNGGR